MKVLGIDPSLSSTGWCILTFGEQNNGIEWGYIKSNPKDSSDKRIQFIKNSLFKLIYHDYYIDHIGIESESMNSRSSSMVQLWELTGAIKQMCLDIHPFRVLMYPPLMARSIVLGTTATPKKGSSKKSNKAYCDWMKKRLNKSYIEDVTDVYDALVVAEACKTELIGSTNFKLAQMRLKDEKILTKSKKSVYSYGTGKSKVQFKDLSKVDEPTFSELLGKYREILGQVDKQSS